MSLPSRLLGANPSIQVSTLLSGSLTTPSAKGAFFEAFDFDSIATYTVGSGGQSSIEFTSITPAYAHLQVRYISRTSLASASANLQVTFNSDTTSGNYSFHRIVGDGTSVSSYGQSGLDNIGLSAGANSGTSIFGAGVVDIIDYKNANKYKTTKILTGLERNNSADSYIMLRSQVWTNTNAITSIKFTPSSGNFAEFSHFALYGIMGA